jgi:hypothetical protein
MTQPVNFDVPTEVDVKGMRERMDAIRLKELLAPESLTERELLCLQMEHPACPSCGGRS